MTDYNSQIPSHVASLPSSGIRKFFDLLENMQDVTALTVGQPDFVTPWHIREAAIESLERGKTYYSCLGYPDCKFMSWDIPTGDKCPDCASALVETARGNVKCSNKDCSYRVKKEGASKRVKADKAEKRSVAGDFADGFEAPPLMDEPMYFGFEDIED